MIRKNISEDPVLEQISKKQGVKTIHICLMLLPFILENVCKSAQSYILHQFGSKKE